MATYKDINVRDLSADLTNDDCIAVSVKNILNSSKSSILGIPEFGTNLTNYLFEPLNSFTKMDIKDSITAQLYKYETRIDNLDITISNGNNEYSLSIDIGFTTKENSTIQIVTVNL